MHIQVTLDNLNTQWAKLYKTVAYIWGNEYKFFCFFGYVLRKQKKKKNYKKRKIKTCVLFLYQNMLILSTFKDTKVVCLLTPYQNVLLLDKSWLSAKLLDMINLEHLFFKKSPNSLMHRCSSLPFALFIFLIHKKKI